MREFSAADKLACVKRELAMREKAYPGWVTRRRMAHVDAKRETELMRAIVADYEELARKEKGDLFEGKVDA